jgi:biotin carboxylase
VPRPRLLLLFPAHSYRLEAYLAAAARVGVDLVLGTDLPQAFARHGCPVVAVDFARPDPAAAAIVARAASSEGALSGVIATNEPSAVVAALVAEHLGLPHNSAASVYATSDKRRMRELLAAGGLTRPRFRAALPGEQAEDLLTDVRFPCVVKPPMLTGSQGVIRADDPGELAAAIARVRSILARHPSGAAALPDFHRLLVEDYLPGREVAVEAILTRGELRPIAIFDKPDELTGPFFEETLYVTPSRLPDPLQREILDVTARAARALGLSHGPIHAELRAEGSHAAVVEIAARSIGGLCSRVVQLVAGPLEDLLVRHAAGLPAEEIARSPHASAGVMMMPIPRSGVLRSVSGLDAARAVPGVEGVTVAIQAGEAIRALPEGASYLGFIFARGETPGDVERALRDSFASLSFDLAPLLAVM